MAHPYKHQSGVTGRAKMRSIHKTGNLPNKVLPMMHSVGENMSGGIRESSNHEQHRSQSSASGMKKGGRIGGKKKGGRIGHHKTKIKPDLSALMATSADQAAPPAPAQAMGAAGAAPPPAPAPIPPQKRGGRIHHYKSGGSVHSDEAADRKLFHKMMAEHEHREMKMEKKASRISGKHKKYARGGRLPMAGHVTKGGAESGVGRLEKTHTSKR